jgi:hypothetical protein
MPKETTRLREMTLRYAVKQDADGAPILVDHALAAPRDAAQLLMRLLQDEASEVFAVLLLSTRHHVLAYYEVSRGTLDSKLVHPRLCAAQHNRARVRPLGRPAGHPHSERRKAMSPGSFRQCLRESSGIEHSPSALAFIARSTSA